MSPPRGWRLSLLLALLAQVVALLVPGESRAQGLVSGPPAADDLALWPRAGLAPVSHQGGPLHSMTWELERDVAWIASGPRLVTLGMVGERLHRLGSTRELAT